MKRVSGVAARTSPVLAAGLVGYVILQSIHADSVFDDTVAGNQKAAANLIVFESRIRDIAPQAIRFQGGFILPTNRKTVYVRETADGESPIARKQLEQLEEEVDEDPYTRPANSGGIKLLDVPTFKLGSRVRCEYRPEDAAIKVVVLAANPEERRRRWPSAWALRPYIAPLTEDPRSDESNLRVSIKARALPLKAVLEAIATSAHLSLNMDIPALQRAGLDLNNPVTIDIRDKPLQEVLFHLIDWNAFSNVFCFRDPYRNCIRVSTIDSLNDSKDKLAIPEWLGLAKNPNLLPQQIVDGQIISLYLHSVTDEILSGLKSLPKLRELEIHELKEAPPAAFAALAELDSVERLSLSGGSLVKADDADQIAGYVARMKSLRSLSLNETGLTDAGMRELGAAPLERLNLYQEGRLTDDAIDHIARMKSLKSLGVTCYVASQQLGAMQFSSSALGRLAELKELELMTFAGLPVPKGLADFPRLKSLQLDAPTEPVFKSPEFLNEDAAADLAEAKTLKYLTIERNKFTQSGWWMIGSLQELRGLRLTAENDLQIKNLAAHGLPKLAQLQLESYVDEKHQVTAKGISYLTAFKSLTRLDLSGQNLAIEDLDPLKDLLNLRELHLYGMKLKHGYLRLKNLTQLQELYLNEVPISQSEYNDLERAMPKTRVYAGGGTHWLWSIRDQQ